MSSQGILYGCNNSDRSDGYFVKDGLVIDENLQARYQMRYIDDTSSKECRYDQRKTDAKCEGCRK